MTVPSRRGGTTATQYSPSGLADVIDTILDKGLVIDAYVRVSLVGIELLTIDARIVIASVDTYLRFAEAVNRLDISHDKQDLPGLIGDMEEGGAKRKVKGATEGALEGAKSKLSGGRHSDGQHSGRRSQEQEDDLWLPPTLRVRPSAAGTSTASCDLMWRLPRVRRVSAASDHRWNSCRPAILPR